jgi:hypothetical protein
MTQGTDGGDSQQEILAKLAQSRAEIRRVLEPAPRVHAGHSEDGQEHDDYVSNGTFPRSRTMRMLMSVKGLGTAGALVGGLLMARPTLALKLVRLFPTSTVARLLLVKAVTAFRARQSR